VILGCKGEHAKIVQGKIRLDRLLFLRVLFKNMWNNYYRINKNEKVAEFLSHAIINKEHSRAADLLHKVY
jgi:hypothetical protein